MKTIAHNILSPTIPKFEPGTSGADGFTLETPKGRARLFERRIEELTKPKAQGGNGLTTDEALFEMRTGGNPDDIALLAAMGEPASLARTERLQQERRNEQLTRLAEENARAGETAAEVKAAMARNVAFNARIDELHRKGFSTDQAILQMRANPKDAALLKAMGA
jgi:hypothetical protein